MKNRIRLKRNKIKEYKRRLLIITIALALLISFLLIAKLGKVVSNKLISYAEIETTRIAKYIMNSAVASDDVKNINIEELFITAKNKNDEIQTIDFDTSVLNQILSKVTTTVIDYFKSVEKGELDKINLTESSLINTDINKLKKGIVTEIPIGVISNNALLSNLGPKLPVKLSLSGEIESHVDTEIKNYGINNTVLTVFINIKVSEIVYMPFVSKKVTVNQRIPIAIKIMQGVVPNCYFGNLNSTPIVSTSVIY